MELPNIDYHFWLQTWENTVGAKRTYSNARTSGYHIIDQNLLECESEIERSIQEYLNDTDSSNQSARIERIVDLIYAWGGPSGRMFYVGRNSNRSPRESLKQSIDSYKRGINLALQSDPSAVDAFKCLRGIGDSYASKHAFFWSSQGPNRLIIIDSKISGAFGCVTVNELFRQTTFIKLLSIFTLKSAEVFGMQDGSKIERALFAFHNNYFLNSNKGIRSNPKHQEDLMEANLLVEKLNIHRS